MYNLDLINAIFATVSENLRGIGKIGIAFSGGIDSTLLAMICKNMDIDTTLLTVGFPRSNDIEFSKSISQKIKINHKILEIDKDDFAIVSKKIKKEISCNNSSHIENCIAFNYVAKLANEIGTPVVLTANGFDELFCGYNNFRYIFDQGSDIINANIESKILKELELIDEIKQIAIRYHISILQPFLSKGFISVAMMYPIYAKIISNDDLLRKHIIRKIALAFDLPSEVIIRRKKALQYGSLIHRYYKKID
ncbi:MAG TPA: asparagine synthase C-terminal domain-containing protein [Nitrososphaeraceae archaeon]|nr:asparagine synthase C-terminal domain-containing protein [Nitrososphaeraceae archaeon]